MCNKRCIRAMSCESLLDFYRLSWRCFSWVMIYGLCPDKQVVSGAEAEEETAKPYHELIPCLVLPCHPLGRLDTWVNQQNQSTYHILAILFVAGGTSIGHDSNLIQYTPINGTSWDTFNLNPVAPEVPLESYHLSSTLRGLPCFCRVVTTFLPVILYSSPIRSNITGDTIQNQKLWG